MTLWQCHEGDWYVLDENGEKILPPHCMWRGFESEEVARQAMEEFCA